MRLEEVAGRRHWVFRDLRRGGGVDFWSSASNCFDIDVIFYPGECDERIRPL